MPASRKTPVLGIHKFGGASLFDAAAVRHAATLIAAQKGGRLVVASLAARRHRPGRLVVGRGQMSCPVSSSCNLKSSMWKAGSGW